MEYTIKIIFIFLLLFTTRNALAVTYNKNFEKWADANCKNDLPKGILFGDKFINSASNPKLCGDVIVAAIEETTDFWIKNHPSYEQCLKFVNRQKDTVIDACSSK